MPSPDLIERGAYPRELTLATMIAMIEAARAGTELAAAMKVAPATSESIFHDFVRTWGERLRTDSVEENMLHQEET